MLTTAKLTVGSRLQYDGEEWKVEAFVGGQLRIRSARGIAALLAISALLDAPGFQFLDLSTRADESFDTVTFPENATPEAIATALERLAHLNEISCGFKSGFLGTALPHEPKALYDCDNTTLSQRVDAKAAELGVTARTLWLQKAAYTERGIYGLLDQRQTKVARNRVDLRVTEALHEILNARTDLSNTTNQAILRSVTRLLKAKYGDEVRPPPESTFNRLMARETKGLGLHGSAKGRRSIHNKPETTYRRFYATRPGEMVLIDSTPLDAFAMDPVSFKWLPVQLTLAMDLYTRSIVGWRFTPVSTKGVDAALLLYDIIRPKLMHKDAPDAARWAYVGVPENIILEIGELGADAKVAGIPMVHPDRIVIDHGKVFVSNTFKDACVRLGTNLQLARPYTPTDKAHVERIFLTIRQNFVLELPGYKGPDIFSRGLNSEEDAYYFIDEIDAKFSLWVAAWWQRRHHQGLDFPGLPHVNLSPNDMYNEGIARAGFVNMVINENMYFELLPTVWRTVQAYGIEFDGLRYDGDILNDYRNRSSPHTGVHAGKWPIRHDPRDRSTAHFYDHETGTWHELRWVHSQGENRPFNESILGYAKALIVARKGNSGNMDEVSETLNWLLDDMNISTADRKKRRLLATNAVHAEQVRQDKANPKSGWGPKSSMHSDRGPVYGSTIMRDSEDELRNEEVAGAPLRSANEVSEDDDDDLGF